MLGTYRVKGYDKKDFDLGILVLRIGGPRLLYTFNHLNYLPSSSSIYKACKNNLKLVISLDTPLHRAISSNISQFFQQTSGFYSIKMDEIALSPKVRYHPETNEFVGICVSMNNYIYKLVGGIIH